VAILIASKVRQIKFGPLPVAASKLCAVVIGSMGSTYAVGPLFGSSSAAFP